MRYPLLPLMTGFFVPIALTASLYEVSRKVIEFKKQRKLQVRLERKRTLNAFETIERQLKYPPNHKLVTRGGFTYNGSTDKLKKKNTTKSEKSLHLALMEFTLRLSIAELLEPFGSLNLTQTTYLSC